ncbi:MAG: alpha/beta hydrolase [Hyphomicrobiaceae bacterium]|nr:alpha/beta hydrolase [Hyphomicrobiaceae bacterium]
MKCLRINDYDMPYIDIGKGTPLVAIHGSLGDFRSWSPVMGPLSQRFRLIVPSLRHFFPDNWDGKSATYTIAQHVSDVIAFIEALGLGPVHLMGHSRGGHIAFRVAQQRPDLIRRLVLAEPGGELDASLLPAGVTPTAERTESIVEAGRMISAGDVDGGLEHFIDRIYGKGAWAKQPAASKQRRRDNASTIVGQLHEQRQAFTLADAKSITVPTLLIGGELTPGMLPVVLQALAAAIPGARKAMIPMAAHSMFEQAPVRFSELVAGFLGQSP